MCNKCNAEGHYASTCLTAATLVCNKCGEKEHRDQWSGACKWNSTRFTIPPGDRNANNVKVRDPGQTTDNRTAARFKGAIAALDKAMTTVAQFSQGGHQEVPDAPYLTECTEWGEQQKELFLSGRKSDKDQSRATNAGKDQARTTTSPRWDYAASRNGQDDFSGGRSVAKATFWSCESDQREQNSDQCNWREHTKLHQERVLTEKDLRRRGKKEKREYHPQEEKVLKPQWLNKEGFSSAKRHMSVTEIETAMENGDIEDEEVERLLNDIYEESEKSKRANKVASGSQNGYGHKIEIVDVGVDLEEENKVYEKAAHECQSTLVSHDTHGSMPAHKEPYVTPVNPKSTERAEEFARDSMISTSSITEASTAGEEKMGGENSKQTNNIIVENLQKALVQHKEQEKMREVYILLKSSKKTCSVPWDLPLKFLNEFLPELARPLTNIFCECISMGAFPTSWKKEYVNIIPKVYPPENYGDLRNLSLTEYFSKRFEEFVLYGTASVKGLLSYVETYIDRNQFAVKGASCSHALINFILKHTDSNEPPKAVVNLLADWSKAFNKVNHNIVLGI